ncbi:hypothetical protein L1987_35961 [Smallanthus sonchifolius]|uniref:Uncharacterized protein n=1 Tax=Smallanthus sonchifolius TaxID=185202 RepID=A0ACB9HBW1_9ASTR|nr:hypothetical protein L1987_35961 [Smallanthus sonchifolius]
MASVPLFLPFAIIVSDRQILSIGDQSSIVGYRQQPGPGVHPHTPPPPPQQQRGGGRGGGSNSSGGNDSGGQNLQQTSTMTTPMTITLQIDQFCNCKGCIRKVKKTLSKLGDVKLLAMGVDIGTFTILTTNHPKEIKYTLKHVFPKKNIILSPETDHPFPQHLPRVNDIATALATMSQVKGLESMEFTQSTSFKFKFSNRHNRSTLSSLPPTLHNIRGSNGVPLEHAPPPPTN